LRTIEASLAGLAHRGRRASSTVVVMSSQGFSTTQDYSTVEQRGNHLA